MQIKPLGYDKILNLLVNFHLLQVCGIKYVNWVANILNYFFLFIFLFSTYTLCMIRSMPRGSCALFCLSLEINFSQFMYRIHECLHYSRPSTLDNKFPYGFDLSAVAIIPEASKMNFIKTTLRTALTNTIFKCRNIKHPLLAILVN